MTLDQLRRFIEIRNKSAFQTNIQFVSDAAECGINVADLGDATRDEDPETGLPVWRWRTPYGLLVEQNAKLTLYPEPGQAVAS